MLSLLELRVIGGEKVLGAQVGKSNDNLFAKIAWWSKSLEGKQRGFQSRVQSDDCCWPMSWQCRGIGRVAGHCGKESQSHGTGIHAQAEKYPGQ